jgi:hypothetical protein
VEKEAACCRKVTSKKTIEQDTTLSDGTRKRNDLRDFI